LRTIAGKTLGALLIAVDFLIDGLLEVEDRRVDVIDVLRFDLTLVVDFTDDLLPRRTVFLTDVLRLMLDLLLATDAVDVRRFLIDDRFLTVFSDGSRLIFVSELSDDFRRGVVVVPTAID
jgi:hypothetical protein